MALAPPADWEHKGPAQSEHDISPKRPEAAEAPPFAREGHDAALAAAVLAAGPHEAVGQDLVEGILLGLPPLATGGRAVARVSSRNRCATRVDLPTWQAPSTATTG